MKEKNKTVSNVSVLIFFTEVYKYSFIKPFLKDAFVRLG